VSEPGDAHRISGMGAQCRRLSIVAGGNSWCCRVVA
jgi:hypothetical protein